MQEEKDQGTCRPISRGSLSSRQCSGPPSVCDTCEKVDTFCQFNLRLGARRKLAYKPQTFRERQQYILEGVLQILKYNDDHAVQALVQSIRTETHAQEIARCLKHNLHHLQGRGLIPVLDVDETDLVSLGLQSLFSHRAGRHVVKTANEQNKGRDFFTDMDHSNSSNTSTGDKVFQTFFSQTNVDDLSETEYHVLFPRQ